MLHFGLIFGGLYDLKTFALRLIPLKNKNLEGINGDDQNSLFPDLLIIIKTAQAMINRSHNGNPDLIGDMINHVGMIVLECMKEAGIPETVRATTEAGADKANQHE